MFYVSCSLCLLWLIFHRMFYVSSSLCLLWLVVCSGLHVYGESSPLQFSIRENDSPPFPKTVDLVSSDSPQSVYYSLSGPDSTDTDAPAGLFSISCGVLKVHRSISRGEFANVTLKVYEYNKLTNAPTGKFISVVIIIVDVNDQAPHFSGSLQFSVRECSPAGTVVGQVNATDMDEPNTLHTKIRYSLLSGTELFSIDAILGVITTKSAMLDRETQDKYLAVVEIRDMDGAHNGLTDTATATVMVTDENDNPPIFRQRQFKAVVQENEAGMLILAIPVDDKDQRGTPNWNAVFTITKGNEDGHFMVETDHPTNEGLLRIVKPLDYEQVRQVVLELEAENEAPLLGCGSRALAKQRVSVELSVADVDEGPAFFVSTLIVRIGENIPVHTLIAVYTATDPESRNSKCMRYYIDSDPSSWFMVTEDTGELRTTRTIDKTSRFISNGVYNVSIRAEDCDGKTGRGVVLVVIDEPGKEINPPGIICMDPGKLGSVVVRSLEYQPLAFMRPFTFTLPPENSGRWSLRESTGSSVMLQLAERLPAGFYGVPVVVRNQQGVGEVQMVTVRVCECSGSTAGYAECAHVVMKSRAEVEVVSIVSISTLSVLVTAVLTLVIRRVLHHHNLEICRVDSPPPFLDNGSEAVLLNFNTEGPSDYLGTYTASIPPSVVEEEDLPVMGAGVTPNTHPQPRFPLIFEHRTHSRASSRLLQTQNPSLLPEKPGEPGPAPDVLMHYGYEGDGSPTGPLSECSDMDVNDLLDFLDTLDPAFKQLADICTGKQDTQQDG